MADKRRTAKEQREYDAKEKRDAVLGKTHDELFGPKATTPHLTGKGIYAQNPHPRYANEPESATAAALGYIKKDEDYGVDPTPKETSYNNSSAIATGLWTLGSMITNDVRNTMKEAYDKYKNEQQQNTDTDNPKNPDTDNTDTSTKYVQNFYYDPKQDEAYMEALNALLGVSKNVPTYKNSYDGQLNDLYNQIVNRDKFSYDVNADALYMQYADKYIQQGRLAMMDAMGQASSLTGGYGNSYAQNAGQQAYQQYLTGLNDKIPELYQIALDRYMQEGDDMYKQYSMLKNMADDEYSKYSDEYDRWLKEYALAKDDVDTAYTRGFNADATNYQRRQDEYNKTINKITSTGYKPTQDELDRIGIDEQELQAYLNYYDQSLKKEAAKSSANTDNDNGFTGSTYSEAAEYLTKYGLDESYRNGLMTQQQWAQKKKEGQESGTGNDATFDSTYSEYVKNFVTAVIDEYEHGREFVP